MRTIIFINTGLFFCFMGSVDVNIKRNKTYGHYEFVVGKKQSSSKLRFSMDEDIFEKLKKYTPIENRGNLADQTEIYDIFNSVTIANKLLIFSNVNGLEYIMQGVDSFLYDS